MADSQVLNSHIVQLSTSFAELPAGEQGELLKGFLYIFENTRIEYGDSIAAGDLHQGMSKVFSLLAGKKITGLPVTFSPAEIPVSR
jgi:hypothetical protein